MTCQSIQAIIRFLLVATLTTFFGCAPTPEATAPTRQSPGSRMLQRMAFPPFEFTPPRIGQEVERLVLPNGIVLFLAADHSLPTLTISSVFKAGVLYEDATCRGVAQLIAAQLASGGTKNLTPTKLTDELELLGISTESSVSPETLSLSMTALAKDADRALDLFTDMLRHPAFDAAALRSNKGRLIDSLRRAEENPTELASREFARLLYTDEHPVGHRLTPAEVRAAQRSDIQRYYNRFIRPDNLWLAVAGDFGTADLANMVRTRLADWRSPDSSMPPPPAHAHEHFEPGVYLLHRPITQASVTVGHFGVDRANPDRNAIEVMNLILGGNGLTGRLAERIRTKEGLAYSVASGFPTASIDTSLFRITVQTRNENVAQVVKVILDEMRRLQTAPVAAEELTTAKGTLINTLVSRFPSRLKTVLTLLESELSGNPPDYFDTLLKHYEIIRAKDVQSAAQRYLHPSDATVLLVGNSHSLETSMGNVGSIHYLTRSPAE